MRVILKQESRAAARKPRDAVAVLFGLSAPTTSTTTGKRVAKLRKPGFTASNTMPQNTTQNEDSKSRVWSQWKGNEALRNNIS